VLRVGAGEGANKPASKDESYVFTASVGCDIVAGYCAGCTC
jgi:hypothetical protein